MMNYFWNVLASHDGLELLGLLMLAAAKATLLIAFAALLCLAFRRLSAATRHLLWASALCAALLLPFLSFIKVWEVPIFSARTVSEVSDSKELSESNEVFGTRLAPRAENLSGSFESSDRVRKSSRLQTNQEFIKEPLAAQSTLQKTFEPKRQLQEKATSLWPQLINWILVVWFAVVLLLLLRLLVGLTVTNLLARRAVEFKGPALTKLFSSLLAEVKLKSTVRLLSSERTLMPIVCGILRPVVLLPADAKKWSEEQQRMVLLHELTHITRRDCLTQMLAQMACAFYWFNPFIWSAARRLRVERERACDDYVLSIGTRPSDYAHHLLEIARSMKERSVFKWSHATSVAMARRSQLEGRLLAILSKENKHGAVSRFVSAGLVSLICVLLLSLAMIRPVVINAQHPHTSNNAFDDEKKNTESYLPASLAINSKEGISTPAQFAEAREAVRAEDAIALHGDPQEQAVINERVVEKTEQSIKPSIEINAQQNIAEAAAQWIKTGVPMPVLKVKQNLEVNPFINIEYRPERKTQTQDKPGDFIEEMASAGYTNLSVDDLIRLKTAGVTAEYVQSLRALGFSNLTPKELSSLGIHGVTTAYIKAIRAAGYNDLSARELTTFRIHDITPEYIKALRDAGYGNLPAKQLTEFAVHRVTPSFINEIRAVGYSNLSPRDLVSLRVHDVTPEFIRKARSRLGELTIKQIIALKNADILEDDKDKGKDKVKG